MSDEVHKVAVAGKDDDRIHLGGELGGLDGQRDVRGFVARDNRTVEKAVEPLGKACRNIVALPKNRSTG